jgi:hypothetical protein
MKNEHYSSAILDYTVAMDEIIEQSELHKIFSNRSLAHLKAKNYSAACADAEACILLQPNWPRGYFRKGMSFPHTQHLVL